MRQITVGPRMNGGWVGGGQFRTPEHDEKLKQKQEPSAERPESNRAKDPRLALRDAVLLQAAFK